MENIPLLNKQNIPFLNFSTWQENWDLDFATNKSWDFGKVI